MTTATREPIKNDRELELAVALMRDGVSDMHCMSIPYLVDEILSER